MEKNTMTLHPAQLRYQNQQLLHYHNQKHPNDRKKIIPYESYRDKIKIVIYTPSLDKNCGGIMVLHHLAKTIIDLNIYNIEVLLYVYDYNRYNNEFCNNFYNPYLIDDKTIVIYPEIVSGNPLNAKHVIRWILLDLGIDQSHDWYKTWGINDLVYHWEPCKLKNSKQLTNIWLNPIIQKYNFSSNRSTVCHVFKKNQWIKMHNHLRQLHPKNSVSLDDKSLESINSILNDSKRLYCYDPNTFFSIMAPLLGCITILHRLENYDKDTYFKSRITYHHATQFMFDYGIAYGNSSDEIDRAFSTVSEAPEKFNHLISLYKSTVSDLVDDIISKVEKNNTLSNTVKNIYIEPT